jgi:hypothetical protein
MEEDKTPEKKPYQTPKLIAHGDVEKITLGNGSGANLDSHFICSEETMPNNFS